jgi:4-hydroxy-tetrahydrodipicolinate synthase
MGGRGAVIAIANVAPGLCVDLHSHFKRNEIERAREIQMKLLRLNDILVKKFDQISAIKEAMNQLGKAAGYPRRPSLPLEEKARHEVEKGLAEVGIH